MIAPLNTYTFKNRNTVSMRIKMNFEQTIYYVNHKYVWMMLYLPINTYFLVARPFKLTDVSFYQPRSLFIK